MHVVINFFVHKLLFAAYAAQYQKKNNLIKKMHRRPK